MSIEVEVPQQLTRAELDRRLAGGWFRSGPVLFRTPMVHVDEVLRDLVHVRVVLGDGVKSRSQRRLLRRNRARFRTVVQPARVDDARRSLYALTRKRFIGFVVSDLDLLVLGSEAAFDTREVCVYDGDKLVAVGYFDLGSRSAASILGLHDPAYARDSLGIYTMLEEMVVARKHGARWYYPGYIVPGLPGFDYKLGLGDIQFRGEGGRWRARANAPATSPKSAHATERLEALEAALQREGVAWQRWNYPASWLAYLDGASHPFLGGLWHLRLTHSGAVVEQLPDGERFRVCYARAIDEIDLFEGTEPNPVLEAVCESRVLAYDKVLLTTPVIPEVVRCVARLGSHER